MNDVIRGLVIAERDRRLAEVGELNRFLATGAPNAGPVEAPKAVKAKPVAKKVEAPKGKRVVSEVTKAKMKIAHARRRGVEPRAEDLEVVRFAELANSTIPPAEEAAAE